MSSASSVRVAERENAKRSFLLVSTVLGKHVPVSSETCRAAGRALARKVATSLHPDTTVIGFAETATGLAEQVAEALDAAWFQTTTRQAAALRRPEPFVESHSHAPDQWIDRPARADPDAPMVIVDDELTTGATAANLIRTLHRFTPRRRYVVAALVDARTPQARALDQCALELGCSIDVVALERFALTAPAPPGWSGGALPARLPVAEHSSSCGRIVAQLEIGYRGAFQHQGQTREARQELAALARAAAVDRGPLPVGTLVLGTGEHLAFAQHFAAQAGQLTSSSTRSPVLVSERKGYPIRDGLAFANPDAHGVPGYAYNIDPARRPHIVVHFQDSAHRARGGPLLDALVAAGAPAITTVTLAR